MEMNPEQYIPMPLPHARTPWLWFALSFVVLMTMGAFVYVAVRVSSLETRLLTLSSMYASTTAVSNMHIAVLEKQIATLSTESSMTAQILESANKEIATTKDTIAAVSDKVGGVEETVGTISGSVTTLQKLATTDLELLKKYSKVYFLNENYTPAHLALIPQSVVYSNIQSQEFSAETLPYLEKMFVAAQSDKITFYVLSAYRSFAIQQKLKTEYTVIYGEGTANAFSADQGYSEHQLGTAVDFITPGYSGELTQEFETTEAFVWLREHAYHYGFVLSYPKKNGYYIYEPWHWRFVGVKLATYLNEKQKNFYDMDQREIDTYLTNLFD